MILVLLGTQDKQFGRLLEAIQREIDNRVIKGKVVVQAGCTKFKSNDMEIFDWIPIDDFNELIKKAELIITHGGVGSIVEALKNNKKVIVAPRLKKYNEHVNDHQLQIIDAFADMGYILPLKDFNKLGDLIEKTRGFKPKKFESNTHNMIKLIENYIDKV